MKNVVWLQLADWHHGARDKFERNLILDKLKQDIIQRQKIDPSLGSINFAIFCGDLANKAASAEYAECATTFLSEIALAADLPTSVGKQSNFFIAPGNHDIDRAYVEKFSPSALKAQLTTPSEVNDWVLLDKSRKYVLAPFEDYIDCVREFTGRDYQGYADSDIINVNGTKIGIACLNSAWMCGKVKNAVGEFDDYGRVIIAEHQVETALSCLDGAEIKLAVLHHPFEWLSPLDHDLAERAICKGFDFVLTGHKHQADPKVVHSALGQYIMIPSGSSFDGRDPNGSLYANSYSFVVVDPLTGMVRIFVRKWSEKMREWTADSDIGSNGSIEFELPSRRRGPAEVSEVIPAVKPHEDVESIRQMIADAESANAEINISTTITKNSTYYTVRHKDPEKPILVQMPEFPDTELGRLGLEKFKKCMEEGREVQFLEGEAIWTPPFQISNMGVVDPLAMTVLLRPIVSTKKAPVRLQLVDETGHVFHQIGFANLVPSRIGTQKMEISISGQHLGAEFSFIFKEQDERKITFKHSLRLSRVSTVDAINTIDFLVGLSRGLTLEVISLEHNSKLMALGGCSFDQSIRSYEGTRLLLGFLTKINNAFGLDIRYPDGAPSEKDLLSSELLASLLDGQPVSVPQDKHGYLVLGHQVGEFKSLVETWKIHPKLVINAEMAAPFEIFGHSIAVKNVKLHYLDTAPADGLDELLCRMNGLDDIDCINIPITYSRVVFEIEETPLEEPALECLTE
jgi:hypothetical protein